jgi:organic radical activating enzyme
MPSNREANSYYCNQKFWWLSVDIERFQTLSCCAATPNKIDFTWMKDNPGQLFNTPLLQKERSAMLNNQPVDSCVATCWRAEANGLVSRRLVMNGDLLTHTNITATPENLHIIVGTSCNMTCSYCCKQYSSAWRRDINDNGSYSMDMLDDRYTVNPMDRIISKLSQKEIGESDISKRLIDEIKLLCTTVKEVTITGGEPFLYNGLSKLVEIIPNTIDIKIWTGLGVDTKRFVKILEEISLPNVSIMISAENTGKLYEFNRYGNTWQRFLDNLSHIKIKHKFNATVSNLTIHGLPDFTKMFDNIIFSPCNDPDFLAINVMDDISKSMLLDKLPLSARTLINDSIHVEPTEQQRRDLNTYVTEFTSRRDLSLDIFPTNFIRWMQQ